MASKRLPVSSTEPSYRFQAELDGRLFGFTFRWNARDGAWYFDLHDSDGTPIMQGTRVVTGTDFLRRIVDQRRPPGRLVALDLANTGTHPGRDELGGRVVLVYEEAASVATL